MGVPKVNPTYSDRLLLRRRCTVALCLHGETVLLWRVGKKCRPAARDMPFAKRRDRIG